MNGSDGFEQRIKESLDQYEVPYNSSDWSALSKRMESGAMGWFGRTGLVAGALVGLLIIGGTTWYFTGSSKLTAPASAENTAASTQTDGASAPAESAPMDQDDAAPAMDGRTQLHPSTAVVAIDPTVDMVKNTDPSKSSVTKEGSIRDANKGWNEQRAELPGAKAVVKVERTSESPSAFHASVNEGCPGTAVEFKVDHMPENGIYLWNFGDGSFSNKANPDHTFTKAGRYQVMLSMSAEGVGTIHNKPSSDVIVIHEAPKAMFNIVKQEYDGHLPSVHFENRSTAAQSYHWNFADGSTSTIAHPDHIYKRKGVYSVELMVTNDIGCENTTIKEVRVEKDYNLDAPSSFSPDGDGSAETFIPEALRNLGAKFHMSVYNSNGEVVYETSDATKPWLGRLNNRNTNCPAGEYVWVVDVKESLHLAETFTGNVKLVR